MLDHPARHLSPGPDGVLPARVSAPLVERQRWGGAPEVSIVWKSLPLYRIPFIEALRRRLREADCRLRVLYGPPSVEERLKQDTGHVEWAEQIRQREFRLGSRQMYWQGALRQVWRSDLVVVEQASKLLLNYALLAAQGSGGPRVALWGHGENFKRTSASPVGELIKRWMSRYPHWWFAYTEGSAATVRSLGYSPERITVVQNAIDTTELREAMRRLEPAQVSALRSTLDLRGNNVAIFIGGLYYGKRLEFLVQAAHHMRRMLPDFELLVVGAGPAENTIRLAAEGAPWLHYVGPQFGEAKVPFFALAKVLLLPAVAGLTVLDSFALEVPIVTLAGEDHPPEVEYLRHGVNAVVVPAGSDTVTYAREVVDLLRSETRRTLLQANCREAAQTYTLEAMVERFAGGVLSALAAGAPRATVG